MSSTENIEYDAWLASAGLPSSIIRQLIKSFGNPMLFFCDFVRNMSDFSILPPRFQLLLKKAGTPENLKRLRDQLKKNNIKVIRYTDDNYPESLMQTDDPPAILFYQGELECLKGRILAMVGSRAASYKGQKTAEKLAEDLSRKGIKIISGLACGIDASAHSGCISGGSPTIAVSACGLERVYPSDNLSLRNEILKQKGLILSEYPPGEKPVGWHFPVRNRIISGLSHALILIEARIKSGSMTTVHHALDQGKDVFVYPGDPDSEKFEGNHQLLREGGIYFTCAEDILEDLHWLDNPFTVRQNIGCSTERKAISPEGTAVLKALECDILSFEQLLANTKMPPSVLMSTLTILQINGFIEALPGKKYQIKH